VLTLLVICLVLFTKYYEGDKVTKDERGGACNTHGSNEKYKVLVLMPEGKRPLGRPGRREEDNIDCIVTRI
jgi:hypothetical protein